MGEFTQNLLKLTEFPFSYSLIGLLALIFGQGGNLEELSFVQIGPLLILIGFVATTLSICDPVGAIQRRIIKGKDWYGWFPKPEWLRWKGWSTEWYGWFIPRFPKKSIKITHDYIFGRPIRYNFPLPYLFAIAYSPEDIKKRYDTIDWTEWDKIIPDIDSNWDRNEDFKKLAYDIAIPIPDLLDGLKQHTIKTKWITAEIDRITALIYFIVIISLFIVATQFSPLFLQNFLHFFGNSELVKVVILIFSISALILVSGMFILRINGLMVKALIVFMYLTALEAIKTNRENFKSTLQDIEGYLDDNNWPLAEYWVMRIRNECAKFFFEETHKGKKIGYLG